MEYFVVTGDEGEISSHSTYRKAKDDLLDYFYERGYGSDWGEIRIAISKFDIENERDNICNNCGSLPLCECDNPDYDCSTEFEKIADYVVKMTEKGEELESALRQKEENKFLIDCLIDTVRFSDHAYGCLYGGTEGHKKTDDPKKCDCDRGIWMRKYLEYIKSRRS